MLLLRNKMASAAVEVLSEAAADDHRIESQNRRQR